MLTHNLSSAVQCRPTWKYNLYIGLHVDEVSIAKKLNETIRLFACIMSFECSCTSKLQK